MQGVRPFPVARFFRPGALLALCGLFAICKDSGTDAAARDLIIDGAAFGTSYRIVLRPETPVAAESLRAILPELSREVRTELDAIDDALSTWSDASELSRFNRAPGLASVRVSDRVQFVFRESLRVHRSTRGTFDPGAKVLFDLWGFGAATSDGPPQIPAESALAAARARSGLAKFTLTGDQLARRVPGVELDFSAIGEGYAIDRMAALLAARGVQSYLVELGGEVRVGRGEWSVALQDPRAGRDVATLGEFALSNRAVATSGSYRNFFNVDGVRYAHVLDPRTGRPARTGVVSASVIGPDCMTADALATALLVLGETEGLAILETLPDYEALLVIETGSGELRMAGTRGGLAVFRAHAP